MNIWAVVTGIGTVASIASWLLTIKWRNVGRRELIYPFLTALLAGVTGYLAWQNIELHRIQAEANALVLTWPYELDYDFTTIGKCRGIVLRGQAFLETYRAKFPETYGTAVRLADSAGVSKSTGITTEAMDDRRRICSAAETMIVLVKGIAGVPEPRKAD